MNSNRWLLSIIFHSIIAITTANSLWSYGYNRKINNPDGRIYGGQSTTIEEIPYQVSIYKNANLFCGGIIISNYWILTASHCVENIISNDFQVFKIRSGSTYHNKNGSIHTINNIIRHEDHGLDIWRHPVNDIAVICVNEVIKFDETRQPIELFNADEVAPVGADAIISGWGYTQNGLPEELQMVQVSIIDKIKCFNFYANTGGIPEKEICAGYDDGGKDACGGDSGGPLTIGGRLVGIASWGRGCAKPGSPGVYTEIAAYRDWLKKHTGI